MQEVPHITLDKHSALSFPMELLPHLLPSIHLKLELSHTLVPLNLKPSVGQLLLLHLLFDQFALVLAVAVASYYLRYPSSLLCSGRHCGGSALELCRRALGALDEGASTHVLSG